MRCALPGGGLNLLVSFDGPVPELVDRLALEEGVPVQPGDAFGAPNCFRFQLGATDDSLRRGVASIRQVAKEVVKC
jgi:aspartate/methionine/tyrosine aminotransferase